MPAAEHASAVDQGRVPHEPAPLEDHDPDHIGSPPPPPRVHPVLTMGVGVLLLAALSGLYVLGQMPRIEQEHRLQADVTAVKNELPRVQAAISRQAEAINRMTLPGDVQALEETTVYARTTGYLHSWLVDIGDEVKAGQLLAEIDTPEVDQQLRQAQAELGQLKAKLNTAKASAQLAASTFARYQNLVKSESVTQQDYDERQASALITAAALEAAEADVNAGTANVQRLVELQSFSRVYAPFGGTITQRSIDLGQLVTTGSGTGQPLYRIAKTDPVRVFVNVPQMYAPGITVGMETKIMVREQPGRQFRGIVTRTARAIDPQTRTLLTEIQSPNSDHALLTGSYVQVELQTKREHPPVLIPATALIVNADGTYVATIDSEDRVQMQHVEVEGDFGPDVGLLSGLDVGTRIVANPGDRMSNGLLVKVMEASPSGAEDGKKKEQAGSNGNPSTSPSGRKLTER